MQARSDKRRHPRRKPLGSQRELALDWNTMQGPRSDASVKVIDIGVGGLQVEVRTPPGDGQLVTLKGEIDNVMGRTPIDRRCRVTHCMPLGNSRYLVGLAYEDAEKEPPKKDPPKSADSAASVVAGEVNHYEVLQISPKADSETIHRVFHFLATRYHPDNQDTGNADLFRQISEAHRVLSDPKLRAGHNVELADRNVTRFRIFESWQNSTGAEAEKRKRRGILELLYAKRVADIQHPTMSLLDLEEMLQIPREHLEFSLWFLREKKLVSRSDNNRFEITCTGVEVAEPLLPAASMRG